MLKHNTSERIHYNVFFVYKDGNCKRSFDRKYNIFNFIKYLNPFAKGKLILKKVLNRIF